MYHLCLIIFLFSLLLYNKPLPETLLNNITKEALCANVDISSEEMRKIQEAVKPSWFGWFSGSKAKYYSELQRIEASCQTEHIDKELFDDTEISVSSEEIKVDEVEKQNVSETEDLNSKDKEFKQKTYKKSLRLKTDKLSELHLTPGSNEAEFSVTTAFQGTTRCKCHIYLWHHTDKVVISDIDGTITKSDVLGHILPVIGNDWAQSGVAQLFSKIKLNGYQIMYLSARAIGQASVTKDYLQSVKQGNVCLPDGPLFLNPDSLYHAFRREVIDR